MQEITFKGFDHAEELYFKSALNEMETLDIIKNRFPRPSGYWDNSNNNTRLIYTKRRLFFCEYNIHCDIQKVENKYRLQLYYTIESINWTYGLSVILWILFVGETRIFAKGDDLTNFALFIGIMGLIIWSVYRVFDANPSLELLNACRCAKKELEACIKLEIEP